jgi:hypothetical protein
MLLVGSVQGCEDYFQNKFKKDTLKYNKTSHLTPIMEALCFKVLKVFRNFQVSMGSSKD